VANQDEDERQEMVSISRVEWEALRTEAAILSVLRTTLRNLCSDEYAKGDIFTATSPDKIEPNENGC